MEEKMKKNSLLCVLSLILLLGVSGNVLAVSDSTGEALTSGVDILSVSVVTSNTGVSGAETANIGIKMAAGSHLPAVILFDFDVDNDTATGGGSIVTGIPTMTCKDGGGLPQTCKADVGGGFDYTLSLVLRGQDDNSSWANCSGCAGGAVQCTTRGAAHDCGADGTCYELGDSCTTGSDCYDSANRCDTGCPGIFAFPLSTLCEDAPTPPCGRGYSKGEWSVGFGQNGTIMNGNTNLVMTYSAVNETEICIEIPWGLIKTAAWIAINNAGDSEHLPFDVATANADPPKFQVTAMHNLRYNGQDFSQPKFPADPPGFYVAIKDWVPDTARVADGEHNDNVPCAHNSYGGYGDLNVDAGDVGDFLSEFGRSMFKEPCPNCKN
jgi:hypothetical protein